MMMLKPQHPSPRDGQAGQGLVEFALVIPLVLLLFMAILELALAFNAFVGLNRASQVGGHLASMLGNQAGADCEILTEIERDVMVPNDADKIMEVVIERMPLAGNDAYPGEKQRYTRSTSLSTDCTLTDGTTVSVPYTLTTAGYPESQRCPVLAGCPTLTPARSTVDNVGVDIRYRHVWATPLNALFGFFAGGDTGWTFVQRNIFRLEPTL
jgi:Flp pilus assembly protein TadG